MNGQIFNKSATLYHSEGEVCGAAQYSVTHLRNVYYQEGRGTVAAETAPSDLLALYLFDAKSTAESPDGAGKTYESPQGYKDAENKNCIFTLAEGDIVVPGIHLETDKPLTIEGARKIMSVYRYKAGRRRMWHRKVVAR